MKALAASFGLAAAGLTLGVAPASAATFVYEGSGGSLPDLVDFRSTINVSDNFIIEDVNLTLNNLTHTFWNDLFVTLTNGSTTVLIANNNGGGSDPRGTFTFDDEALTSVTAVNTTGGSFRPLGSLSAFDGGNASGSWQLRILDEARADVGNLGSWTLTLTGTQAGAVPEPATWAMMILGFGFVGGGMRTARRRQKVVLSYA
ncbi:PEPxxWA-CTERM sorting domain-containing protein [Erythrobacter sp.]|uniref:PEPxxWA-CTERM sorting domain-containing protein n=1 Tax=Erythrobacter sp. TaxID=1042 RepID=UPI0025ECE90E|nr:PEPxxWA-CTERM sorting domain-containing protein [Erythrobacter sp.]